MGILKARKLGKKFTQALSADRALLAAPQLFDPGVPSMRRSLLASLLKGEVELVEGDEVLLVPEGPGVSVFRGDREIAHCKNPPADLRDRIEATDLGIAKARVAKVRERIHKLELEVC